jgi:hypothetical protein
VFFVGAILLFTPLISHAYHSEFTRPLKKGMDGEDIYELQVILNSNPATQVANSGPGSPGKETKHFGDKTRKAVILLQEMYASEVLAPLGLTQGTGYVGSYTLALLRRLQEALWPVGGGAAKAGAPQITEIRPKVINELKEDMTIIGTGFTPTGNIIIVSTEDKEKFKDKKSDDGTTLKFNLHFGMGEKIVKDIIDAQKSDVGFGAIAEQFLKLMQYSMQPTPENPTGIFKDGRHVPITIMVKNENGNSNQYQMYVDLKDILEQGPEALNDL